MANTKIDNLANEIMEGLKEYADLASDDVKRQSERQAIPSEKKLLHLLPLIPESMRSHGV